MAGFSLSDEELRAQRRSFTSSSDSSFSSSEKDDDDFMFDQVQNYVATVKPAWFDSSRASPSRNLSHKLCTCDSTLAELRVGVRDDRMFAPCILHKDRAELPPSPCQNSASTRRRPHRAHRCIAESLAIMPTIVDPSG